MKNLICKIFPFLDKIFQYFFYSVLLVYVLVLVFNFSVSNVVLLCR